MSRSRIAFYFALILAPLGCATTASDPGFADVQRLASSRVHQQIQWNQNTSDDQQVDDATAKLLKSELTVDQAVQIAMLNNRSLQAEYCELGIAQSDLVQAGLLANPIFGASIRGSDHHDLGPDVEFSITQEFLDLLWIPARKKIAAAKLEQTKLQVAGKVFVTAQDVKTAYFTLAGDEQMLQMRHTAADAIKLSADTAQKMADAGNLNDLDLANELATAAEAQADVMSASAQVDQDRQHLIELMGIDAITDVKVAARLPDPIDAPPIAKLGEFAKSHRLDLLAAKQAIAGAAQTAKLTDESRYIPNVAIGLDTERESDGNRITGPTFELPIPLLDQGQASTMRDRAILQQTQQQYLALATQIGSQVRQASQKLTAARERARLYRATIIPLRHRVVEQAQLHYNGMLLGIFQLLDARQREIDAGREYVAALRDYWIARCELERAVGGDLSDVTSGEISSPQFGG